MRATNNKNLPDKVQISNSFKFDDYILSPSRPLLRTSNNVNKSIRGDKRLIERGSDFYQSTGKISLRKKIKRKDWRYLYSIDWFHSLIDAPTPRIVFILLTGYMSIVLLFAVLYYTISSYYGCNLGLLNFIESFSFSLQTMATIGYGTQDIFFDDCLIPILLLSLQICIKLIVDAVVIGIIYCRLARPHARASTIIFSNKSIIRRIRGKLYFMFQLCELRKHQLVEAHVRVYVVKNEVDIVGGNSQSISEYEELDPNCRTDLGLSLINESADDDDNDDIEMNPIDSGSSLLWGYRNISGDRNQHNVAIDDEKVNHSRYYQNLPLREDGSVANLSSKNHPFSYMQTCSMRLNHPNDALGGMLLLMTPQVIVHELDMCSPLYPPPVWYSNYNADRNNSDCIRWNPPRYEYTRNPDRFYDSQLLDKISFPNINERINGCYPQQNLYSSLGIYEFDRIINNKPKPNHLSDQERGGNNTFYPSKKDRAIADMEQDKERAMIERFLIDRQVEVIVIVEGTDAATGGNVQARHSYTCSEIEWNKTFKNCIFKDTDYDNCTTVDFSLFHELCDVSKDAPFAGVIASCL